jgi:hypothetical protein
LGALGGDYETDHLSQKILPRFDVKTQFLNFCGSVSLRHDAMTQVRVGIDVPHNGAM